MANEHINRLRQMIARDNDIKQKINAEIERNKINDYRNSYQPPSTPTTSHTSKFPQPDLKIDVLTDENKALKKNMVFW